MNLQQVFRLQRTDRLALVGAGGKTTVLFQLAREFEPPVVVTASTHLGEWQSGFADRHLTIARPEDILRSGGQIEGVTLLTGAPTGERRLAGLDDESLDALHDLANHFNFPLLIEADGSRQRPLKAPAENEPAIPAWVNRVIVVAGLSGLGQPLDEVVAHRPEQFARLSGLDLATPVTAEGLAQVLTSPEGGLKNVPQGARTIALLNQADEAKLADEGMVIAKRIVGPFDAVVVAALENKKIHAVVEPTAGVILAAGGSERFGQPKMLLPWRGKPLVRHAAETALAAGLWPVIVVLGANNHQVRAALNGLPVTCVENSEWRAGQSSSVRRGIESLPKNSGAAVFLLGDQPFVPTELVRELKEQHYTNLAPVIAPRVGSQRATPTLFDRSTFEALSGLSGDTGGRAILDNYSIEYVEWDNRNLLLDIDTPEDYRRLQELG